MNMVLVKDKPDETVEQLSQNPQVSPTRFSLVLLILAVVVWGFWWIGLFDLDSFPLDL
jgi:hypothetical protein